MSAVHLDGVEKKFGDFVALRGVTTDVREGSFHAFVGENGAGKTTLMRVLYGAIAPTAGRFALFGEDRRFGGSEEAIAAGVGMVSQHYAIVPELTCLQNLVLGAEGGPVLDRRAMTEKATALADRMGFRFDWHRSAEGLSPAQAQKLEILKLLWRDARIMILDEPTAMLSPADGDALFASLRLLVDEGRTVLLVTHAIPEVLDHCERVTVLRAGEQVADSPVADVTGPELARLIVGGEVLAPRPIAPKPEAKPALKIDAFAVRDDRGVDRVKGLDLTIREGEMVGIAGVDGSGQRELVHALVGTGPGVGSVSLDGDPLVGSAADRIDRGVRLIPEDRHEEGVVDEWSLVENSVLGLQRRPTFRKGGRLDTSARQGWTARVAERFATRHPGLSAPMRALSGGNQQRFVAARALLSDPKLLIAYQPARGLDINATTAVYGGIREACDAGAAALVVSYDLDELLEHCDRVVVMEGGRLHDPGTRDRDTIGRLMVGSA